MTTFNAFADRNRDMQDSIERHVFGEQTFSETGSLVKVRGTGTIDEEVIVINNGVGMQLAKNSNTEVFVFSGGSDTSQKVAYLTIPRNKQRAWKENTNGIQNLSDPKRAVEFNEKRTYIDDPAVATRGGVFEVVGDTVYIRGNLVVSGDLEVAGNLTVAGVMNTSVPVGPGLVTVPGFSE